MEKKVNDLSNCRVLIVDDTETNLDILVDALTKYYRISVALDGKTALQDIAENPPDLILLDIMMPGMDGYEVCQKLKANPEFKDIPVIFLTAMTEKASVIKGFEAGAVDYVTKPFNLTELLMRVKTHLQLQSARILIESQNKELIKAAKFQEDVNQIVRHDLKTPLNPIIGFANFLLSEENLSEKTKRYLKIIEKSGYRMLNMINLSLDLFKMERKIYELNAIPVNLLKSIANMEDELEGYIKGKDLTIKFEINGNSPGGNSPGDLQEKVMIMGEELLCYSMFANLIKNALEASPKGGVVTISLDDQKENSVEVCIHNKGCVPGEILSSFFEKYTTSGKFDGTGLGTYSAKLMAETLRGNIKMTSCDQEGTTITVQLPKFSETL
jgi:CheY-like chemotaxis protein